MPQIVFDAPVERLFEVGVDRGVLYPLTGPGVPWNGLINVKRMAAGGATRSIYIDGEKWRQESAPEEFVAELSAYYYPDEFSASDGVQYDPNGIAYDNQPREQFGLSYRTMLGSSLDPEHGYKIHLVYNALATPTQNVYGTITATVDPTIFTWTINTVPVVIPGYRPTAHIILDSTKIDPAIMSQIELELYGGPTVGANPTLPQPGRIVELLGGNSAYPAANLYPQSGLYPSAS